MLFPHENLSMYLCCKALHTSHWLPRMPVDSPYPTPPYCLKATATGRLPSHCSVFSPSRLLPCTTFSALVHLTETYTWLDTTQCYLLPHSIPLRFSLHPVPMLYLIHVNHNTSTFYDISLD